MALSTLGADETKRYHNVARSPLPQFAKRLGLFPCVTPSASRQLKKENSAPAPPDGAAARHGGGPAGARGSAASS